MKKTLKPAKASSYLITLTVTADEQVKAKEKALKTFQRDLALPGFRKGFVPLHLVEQNVQPEYLTIGVYESLTNTGLQEILAENKDLRFIGEPYNFSHVKEGDDTVLTLSLDVFPEVKVGSDAWKKAKINPITPEVTQQEIDEAMLRLKKNFAEYVDSENIGLDTISKISMEFLDKEGNSVEKGTLYIGEPEFEEFSFFKKEFIGKKKGEAFTLTYKEKDFPPTVQAKKTDAKVEKVTFTALDIKNIVLPEMTEETIKKVFGGESTVKTEAELIEYIRDSIAQQKTEELLVNTVEEYLKTIRKDSFDVEVPHTFVEEEFKVRYQNLEKRFGNQEKMQTYINQLGEEKSKTFFEDIKAAAKESLEKFFILQKLTELLELEIDWDNQVPLLIEKKLYEKLTGVSLDAKNAEGTEAKGEKAEKTKKAPAKKAAAKK